MGVPLVTESIMWILRDYIPFYFWYVVFAMLSSQGILITLVFLCNHDAYQQLHAVKRHIKSRITRIPQRLSSLIENTITTGA